MKQRKKQVGARYDRQGARGAFFTMARRIELWPLDRLIPYARNARTHSDEQVAQIAASIVEFGFCNPILVDSRNGIVAGHGRLLAARKLGLDEVPVIVLDHLSETQRRAYLLADNRLSELAGWDSDLLALELKELTDAGFDATLAGFGQKELDDFLASLELEEEAEARRPRTAFPRRPTGRLRSPATCGGSGRTG
jgi:ParB-like chromosome segregation protein Spo0J